MRKHAFIFSFFLLTLFGTSVSHAVEYECSELVECVTRNASSTPVAEAFVFPEMSDYGRFILTLKISPLEVDPPVIQRVLLFDRQTNNFEVIDRNESGEPGNGPPGLGYDVSADGRFVCYASESTNISNGNGERQIFLLDRQTNQVELISKNILGQQGNERSDSPNVSDDGRYIAFVSWATNLLETEIDRVPQIYRFDRHEQELELVSVRLDGTPATEVNFGIYSSAPRQVLISSDGRLVCFQSKDGFLVQGVTNAYSQLFMRDLNSGITELVSAGSLGQSGDGNSFTSDLGDAGGPAQFDMSADGRFVVFHSLADNLADGTSSFNRASVFRRDRIAQTTELISFGEFRHDFAANPTVSNDGRFVCFFSAASGISPYEYAGPGFGLSENLYRFDHQLSEFVLVPSSAAGDGPNGGNENPSASLSADGKFVAFPAAATNLIYGQQTEGLQIFVRDLLDETIIDCNGNAVPDDCEQQLNLNGFVAWLLEHSNPEQPSCQFDVNNDGTVNGLDIEGVIEVILWE